METVKLVCGQQPVKFTFAVPPDAPPIYTTTTTGFSQPMPKDGIYATYQGVVKGTTGAQTATIVVQCTNDPKTAGQDDIPNQAFQNFAMGTTSASTAVTQANAYFRPDMTGQQVYAAGVPNGATFTYVSPSTGTLSANATATATVQARFQDINWVTLGTITLSGTVAASDGFATASAWKWVRVNVSAITGTGATVQVIQGN